MLFVGGGETGPPHPPEAPSTVTAMSSSYPRSKGQGLQECVRPSGWKEGPGARWPPRQRRGARGRRRTRSGDSPGWRWHPPSVPLTAPHSPLGEMTLLGQQKRKQKQNQKQLAPKPPPCAQFWVPPAFTARGQCARRKGQSLVCCGPCPLKTAAARSWRGRAEARGDGSQSASRSQALGSPPRAVGERRGPAVPAPPPPHEVPRAAFRR